MTARSVPKCYYFRKFLLVKQPFYKYDKIQPVKYVYNVKRISKLKEFTDDKFELEENGRKFSKTDRKHCGKRRNCSLQKTCSANT